MGNQALANKVLTGSSGNLWFNGQLLANLSKIEAKVKGNLKRLSFAEIMQHIVDIMGGQEKVRLQ